MKKNYQQSTVLPSVSKIYERLIQDQMLPFIQSFLFLLLCGSWYTACTSMSSERLQETIDNGDIAGASLENLSKAYDCLNHDLLIVKLGAYGFSRSALQFIHCYLTDRKQRVKVNSLFSTMECIFHCFCLYVLVSIR